MFKKIFADEVHTENLIKMLKAILPDLSEGEFTSITLRDPSLLPKIKEGKTCVVDLLLKTKSDYYIHVELQIRGSAKFIDRAVFYHARLLADQLMSGKKYVIKRSISIFILVEFSFIKNGSYINRYRLRNEKNQELTDLLEIIIMELPELPKQDDGTPVWSWAQLFKAKTKKEFNMLERNTVVAETVAKIMEFSKDEIAQMQYDYELRAELDYNMHIEDALEEGERKGKIEGRVEGKIEGKIEAARAMLKKGYPIEDIADITKLSVEEIISLKTASL
jgi:predicted transposase/invertase (TIGR01784 family)